LNSWENPPVPRCNCLPGPAPGSRIFFEQGAGQIHLFDALHDLGKVVSRIAPPSAGSSRSLPSYPSGRGIRSSRRPPVSAQCQLWWRGSSAGSPWSCPSAERAKDAQKTRELALRPPRLCGEESGWSEARPR